VIRGHATCDEAGGAFGVARGAQIGHSVPLLPLDERKTNDRDDSLGQGHRPPSELRLAAPGGVPLDCRY